MKKLLLLLWFIPLAASAQNAAISGVCQLGAAKAKVSGMASTNYQLGVIPSCTVTVYLSGTTTLATIYADGSNTPLANPFTANQDGTWLFFVSSTAGYDVTLSGGVTPNTYPSPKTLVNLAPNPVGAFLPANGATSTGTGATNVVAFPGTVAVGATGKMIYGVANAVGNCSTDDHTALQAALTSATGGWLFIPPSSGSCYTNRSTLSIPAGTTLMCLGNAAIKITSGNSANVSIAVANASVVGCNLQGRGVTDYTAANWPSEGAAPVMVDLNGATNVWLTNNSYSNYGYAGVRFQNTKNLWVSNSAFAGLPAGTGAGNGVIAGSGNYNFGALHVGSGVGYGPYWFDNVDFSGGATGMNSQSDLSRLWVTNSNFHDIIGQHGAYLDPGAGGMVFDNDRFWNLPLDGLKLTKSNGATENGSGIIINNINCYQLGNACINAGIDPSAPGGIVEQNWTISNLTASNVNDGFNFNGLTPTQGGTGINISNPQLHNITNYGIYYNDATGNVNGGYIDTVGGTAIHLYPGVNSASNRADVIDTVISNAGTGAAYNTGGSVVAQKVALDLEYGFFGLKNTTIKNMNAAASYTALESNATLEVGSLNDWDTSKSTYQNVVSFFTGSTFASITSTQESAIASPKSGTTVYNSTTGSLDYYNGSAWQKLTPATGSTTNSVTFNNSGSGAASGTTFNGSSPITVSYNTFGLTPYASTAPNEIAYTPGATTPSIAGCGPVCHMNIANTGATTITNFTGGSNGMLLVLTFQDVNTTLSRAGAGFYLDGSTNYTSTAHGTMMLVYYGGVWYQVGKVPVNG